MAKCPQMELVSMLRTLISQQVTYAKYYAYAFKNINIYIDIV